MQITSRYPVWERRRRISPLNQQDVCLNAHISNWRIETTVIE